MSAQEKLSQYHQSYEHRNLEESIKILGTIQPEEQEAIQGLWEIFNKYPPDMANAAAGFALVRLGDPDIREILLSHLALGTMELDFSGDNLKNQVGFAFPTMDFSTEYTPDESRIRLKSVIAAHIFGSPQFKDDTEIINALRKYLESGASYFLQDFGGLISILGIPESIMGDGREVAALSLLQLSDQESITPILRQQLSFLGIRYKPDQKVNFFRYAMEQFPQETSSALEEWWRSDIENAIKFFEAFGGEIAQTCLTELAESHPKRRIQRKANRALSKIR